MMLTTKTLLLCASLAISISTNLNESNAIAHGGRTNSSGCHRVRATGGYHCHNSGSKSIKIPEKQSLKKACITSNNVNIRSAPNINSAVVSTLRKNQCVMVIRGTGSTKVNNGYIWYQVILSDNRKGYVVSKYISDA